MKQRYLLLLLFLLPFVFKGQQESPYRKLYNQAQELYNSPNPTDASDSIAYVTYIETAKLLEKSHQHDSMLADSYTKAAILKQMKAEDSLAIRLFAKALRVIDQNKDVGDSLKYQPLLYSGSSYYTMHQFDSANYFYQRAETIIDKYPHLPERGRLYNKMGALYYEEGNFHQSLNYFSKALSLLDTTDRNNDYLLVNYYNNIAVAYKKLGKYQDALNTYKKILPYNISRDGLMHNIGTVYLDLGQPNEALKYLHAVKVPAQQQYNSIAVAHLQLNNTDTAAYYIDLATKQAKQNFKTTDNGISLYVRGQILERQHEYKDALKTYHRAVIELDPDFNDTVVDHNPASFPGLHSFSDLFNALAAKARIQKLLYEQTSQKDFLHHSLQSWEAALLLARTVQQSYDADASRLFLNNNLQPASEEAVATAFMLYKTDPAKENLEKIFTLAETSKAAVLQIKLQQASLDALPGLPVSLLQQQKTEQILLARLQVRYETSTDSIQQQALQQQIRDQEIKLSEVNRQLNEDATYAAAHNTQTTLKVADLQKTLSPDAAMISYYLIGEDWLAFVLLKDSLIVQQLASNNLIQRLPQTLRQQLPSHAVSANQLGQPIADMHQLLIKPVQQYLQGIKRLVIIPDHELQYIPFEVLHDSTGKMLLENYAVSYEYSAAFFNAAQRAGTARYDLGLAPFGGSRKTYPAGFSALPASAKELASIDGTRLIDTQATKQAFIAKAPFYATIHLATHAAANDHEPENSFIAFYPAGSDTSYKLFQPEIYTLDLHNAQLVILSACETGHGQFVHGEGMMSLARAFSYAGCKSVITSLWKADDASTAYITDRLHHHLQAGKSKDVALQLAKLDYLHDDNIAQRLKSPAYWSHLVVIGDTAPLYTKSYHWWMIPAIVLILLLALFSRKPAKLR